MGENSDASLSFKINVSQSPDQVFKAINDVRRWWIGEVEGTTNQVGAEFSYKFKTFHDTTQKIEELIPGRRIVWKVTKSHIDFVKDKNEWLNTRIIFDLAPVGRGTEITFTHQGLTPRIECYGGCSGGWDHFIKKSLNNFIENGKGVAPEF